MTPQDRTDAAMATAQTVITQARMTARKFSGRVGLRQMEAMLRGELEETRAQLARGPEYPQGEEG